MSAPHVDFDAGQRVAGDFAAGGECLRLVEVGESLTVSLGVLALRLLTRTCVCACACGGRASSAAMTTRIPHAA